MLTDIQKLKDRIFKMQKHRDRVLYLRDLAYLDDDKSKGRSYEIQVEEYENEINRLEDLLQQLLLREP